MRRTIAIAVATVVALLGVGTAGMVLLHDDAGSGWGRYSMTTSQHMGGDTGRTDGFGPRMMQRSTWASDEALSGLSGHDLDRAFLADMIGHHMAAVMMSQQLLVQGLDEHAEVGDLASTIRDDQMDEIVWMRSTWSRMGA